MANLFFDIFGRDKTGPAFQSVTRGADALSVPFGKIAGMAGAAFAVVGGFEALKSMGTVGLSTAANLEQANISFTTMLGSGEKAKAFLGDLSKFAASTPFELPGLQTSASALISAGIDASKVIPIMTSLGNATSGMGTGAEGIQRATVALQQMNAAQRITGEDLNQLRDAGIPVYDLLAAATGKSKEEVVALAQSGKLGKQELDQLMGALESGKGLERFNGLMAAQSQSLTGMWSTLKDTFSVGLAEALAPAIPIIKDGIGGATAALGVILPKVSSGISELIGGVRAFGAAWKANDGDVTSSGFPGFMERVANVVRPLFDEMRGAVWAFGAAWKANDGDVTSSGLPGFMERLANVARPVFDAITQAAQTLGPVFAPLIPQIIELASSFSPLHLIFQAIQPLLPQIVGLVAELAGAIGGALGAVLPSVTSLMGSLIPLLSEAFVSLMPAATAIIGAVVNAFTILAPVIGQVVAALAPLITSLLSQLMPIVVNLVNTVLPPVINIFMNIVQAIIPLVSVILGLLIPVIQALMPVVVTVFSAVAGIITAAMQIVQGIIEVVTGIVSGNWAQVWSGVLNIFSGIWNTIIAVASGILRVLGSAIVGALGVIAAVWNSVWSAIGGFFAGIWNGIVSGASGAGSNLVSVIAGIGGRVMGALAGAGGWLVGVGRDLIQGLINGARGMIDSAVQAVRDVGGAMLDGIKGFLGIRSPSTKGEWIGQMFGAGIVRGADGSRGSIASAMGRLSGAMLDGFSPDLGVAAAANLSVAGASPVVNVYVGNEQLDTRTYRIAGEAIGAADWRAGTRMAR